MKARSPLNPGHLDVEREAEREKERERERDRERERERARTTNTGEEEMPDEIHKILSTLLLGKSRKLLAPFLDMKTAAVASMMWFLAWQYSGQGLRLSTESVIPARPRSDGGCKLLVLVEDADVDLELVVAADWHHSLTQRS